jgi:peptide deformylase
MIKFSFFLSIVFISMNTKQCKSETETFSLTIPKKGFEVVQHLPVNQKGRNKNTLYLPPREITKKECNTQPLNEFIARLHEVMIKTSGVGIAANQVGKRLQIFIIEANADNPRYQVLGPVNKQVFINPKITKVSKEKKNFWHGCLSANGEDRGNVATYEWIEYESLNERGDIQTGRLDGFAAVIFQHEFRHLLNGTYLDIAKQFLPKAELDKKIKSGELPFFEITSDTLPLLIGDYTVGKSITEYHSK